MQAGLERDKFEELSSSVYTVQDEIKRQVMSALQEKADLRVDQMSSPLIIGDRSNGHTCVVYHPKSLNSRVTSAVRSPKGQGLRFVRFSIVAAIGSTRTTKSQSLIWQRDPALRFLICLLVC